jgi:formylglycine-generating enzyme required for sulfatase activity
MAATKRNTMSISMAMATVGNPGNAADLNGNGRVDAVYAIGKFEVTVAEYSQFLNAVAATDPYRLYNPGLMTNALNGGINRMGSDGQYSYSPIPGTERFPITGISWFDAARFTNWLANGQPTGSSGPATTEDGAYSLNGRTSGLTVQRNSINPNTGIATTFALPSEDEWYKAAYYSPELNNNQGGYTTYATQSDAIPGNSIGSDANQVNYILDKNGFYSVTQEPFATSTQNYLTAVGSYSKSPGPYGTFDQNGGVWEILSSTATSQPFVMSRGGGWTSVAALLQSGYSIGVSTESEAVNAGFRVVQPAPSSSLARPEQSRSTSTRPQQPSGRARRQWRSQLAYPDSRSALQLTMVPVTDAGNVADPLTGIGSVSHHFLIGTTNITIEQYCRFLNAVARNDAHGLYNPAMASDHNIAGISRSGVNGSYQYSVINNDGDSSSRPITYVSWFDAARFTNWLSNGQPSGHQTSLTTEDGTYRLIPQQEAMKVAPPRQAINPNSGKPPSYFLPAEDEWYKAAYYSPELDHGNGGYYLYATQSNTAPTNQPSTGGSNEANLANNFIFYNTQSNIYEPLTNYLSNVGTFVNSKSYYGTLDQAGLVYEWTDLNSSTHRGLRGGYWFSAGQSTVATTFSLSTPDREANDAGFRLAAPLHPELA